MRFLVVAVHISFFNLQSPLYRAICTISSFSIAQMSNAVYQQFPLPPKHQIIRLLRLDECIYDSPDDEALPTALHCSFEVHDLGSAPEFVALSYAWGADTLGDEFLTIDGHAWPTRQNLRDAMLHIWDERAWERKGAWHTTRQKEAWEDFKDMPYSISRPVVDILSSMISDVERY